MTVVAGELRARNTITVGNGLALPGVVACGHRYLALIGACCCRLRRAPRSDLIVAKHRNGPTATVTVAHQFHYSRLRDMSGVEEPDVWDLKSRFIISRSASYGLHL